MDSLIFAINSVAPIVLLMAVGYLLKKLGLMSQSFAKAANKLVFHVFLPITLFLNIYNITDFSGMDFGYFAYAAVSEIIIFILAAPLVMLITKRGDRRGVLLQAAFRSNYTLIGVPLAIFLCGSEGGAVSSLLSALAVPLLNVLSVISYCIYKDGEKPSVKKMLVGIVKNPLIQAIFAGLVFLAVRAWFTKAGISFRLSNVTPVYTVLEYLSALSTPLALLVLGAQFEFSAVPELKKEIIWGTLLRSVIVPAVGLGCAYLFFDFEGVHFASFIALFATPLGVSSVPMAQEMGADATLAGQIVAWSAIASIVTIFLSTFLLSLAGVF